METTRRVLIATAMAACLSVAAPALAASTVHVSLSDRDIDPSLADGMGMNMGGDMSKAIMSVTADVQTVAAGEVTFEVKNDAKGFVHEMIVAKAPADAQQLPFVGDRVDEDAAGAIGEVSELNPGESGSVTLSLEPGSYVLFCNVKGHYGAGMWTTIAVR